MKKDFYELKMIPAVCLPQIIGNEQLYHSFIEFFSYRRDILIAR